MFGKTDWFGLQQGRQRLRPVSWQGTAYRLGWLAVILLPALLLLTSQRVPEAFVWLTASSGYYVWDWREVKRGLQSPPAVQPASEVLYIGDEPPVQAANQDGLHFGLADRRERNNWLAFWG